MKRNFIIGLIVLVGITILLVGGNNSVYNQRVNPVLAINQKNMSFQSHLKEIKAGDSLPKSDSKFTELQTEEKKDENGNSYIVDPSSDGVKTGDSITVNYDGWLANDNSSFFDSSFNRGDSGFTFTVGQGVIEGWSEGVLGMKVGEIRLLKIPSKLGYDDQAVGSIPANSDLMFYVELISIND